MVASRPGLNTSIPESSQGEYVLSFGDILRMLWRRLWLIAWLMLVFVGLAIGYSLAQTPRHEASTKILVGQALEGGTSETNLSASDVQGLQILTKTVAEAIDSRRAAAAVIEKADLSTAPGTLMDDLSVEPVTETQFVTIKYEGADPEQVQKIVNTYGEVASEQISEISPEASAVKATVWDRASLPDQDNLVSPKPARNALLALVLATMLGVTLAFLLEVWESPGDGLSLAEEVERVSGVPTIGVIPTPSSRGGNSNAATGHDP